VNCGKIYGRIESNSHDVEYSGGGMYAYKNKKVYIEGGNVNGHDKNITTENDPGRRKS
jgi:hypothetical protein